MNVLSGRDLTTTVQRRLHGERGQFFDDVVDDLCSQNMSVFLCYGSFQNLYNVLGRVLAITLFHTRLFRLFPSLLLLDITRNVHFPCSADHVQDWQPYPVDPYSAMFDDHTYIHKQKNTKSI